MDAIRFSSPPRHEAAEALRHEVRAFLAETIPARTPLARSDSWNGYDRDFSRKMGARGWLGMTWPKQYGGHERSAFERYVVVEETLAAGAPVLSHWIADRQSGPTLLRFGTEEQKGRVLPGIAAGETCFCIGMSEPDSGSDLAATRTRAVRSADGWRITGTKIWTSNAHNADYMILFCRSGDSTPADRQAGTSQFLIDMKNTPGLTVRPIIDLAGQHHFNECHFEDALVPAGALIGTEGQGWQQVMSELAFERSGPERFLSSIQLIVELIAALQGSDSDLARAAIGRLTAHLIVLRRLSRSVAAMLEAGENPALHAAIVKDQGALFEQAIPDIARSLIDAEPDRAATSNYNAVLANIVLNAPSWSLRGGTREILRGIIARGLGLR
ncbi:acyl-CoA dehydrogenase family protein [Sphingomonas immobilis]|uniref:Acyl-CoA dehydrogenase family protein n=1 Tax=Sphingomonas immobilis TaxID=3063997 RepID=A0ABT8ZWZ8_9SPHN|nr:acyl-CoA dehydrogenase family protein [Sphingomonas sp. CA1-15]MDO7842099.1 acyl-CoA dehydrogenase family protein [Sphingomonas sp. CA1-15]